MPGRATNYVVIREKAGEVLRTVALSASQETEAIERTRELLRTHDDYQGDDDGVTVRVEEARLYFARLKESEERS
jgi:hypothetical protein